MVPIPIYAFVRPVLKNLAVKRPLGLESKLKKKPGY